MLSCCRLRNRPLNRGPKQRDASINVWTIMKSLTLMQYLLFFSGWLAWTVDAIGMSCTSMLDDVC